MPISTTLRILAALLALSSWVRAQPAGTSPVAPPGRGPAASEREVDPPKVEPPAERDATYTGAKIRLKVGAKPGPYLLTRAMWVGGFSSAAYSDKTAMGADVVALLRDELQDLRDAGCEFVQFDEPVLTEIAMSENSDRRTFM